MTFSDRDKLKALAIVHIFETSRPFGDYAACVVLNDGAGVSYGINQFTHRSGSLLAVVQSYLANGGKVGTSVLEANLPMLRRSTPTAIRSLSENEQLKKALKAAAVTIEMKNAQTHVAFERYLRPAIDICRSRGFVLPLSLAVVYDSITHGSWERIAARVSDVTPHSEKAWITEYVRKRHFWLINIPRLKPTTYRTKFFLDQIATGNWSLRLPMIVHGLKLTERELNAEAFTAGDIVGMAVPAVEPAESHAETVSIDAAPDVLKNSASKPAETPQAQPPVSDDGGPNVLESAGGAIDSFGEKFDRVDNTLTAVTSRADSVKSLWTTVIGAISQAAWAVFGFLAGLPTAVWIVVAMIAAALMLVYLYRQIEMGKIREQGRVTTDERAI